MRRSPPVVSFFFLLLLAVKPGQLFAQSNPILAENGKVLFLSEAPLEIIRASSDKLKGAIDKSKSNFAFSVDIRSFRGFNGDLQREHFHENYMETERKPTASFSGKFIEPVDFAVNGTYVVRAKGILMLHGIQKERIIKGVITVNDGTIDVNAVFTVRLEDHDIKVPKIVYEKIAEEIRVEISIRFKN
jgi:polyisoprenoid-binding protein YceI